jgi:pimeloyl-ACP methyl ester carboxylesterase
MPETRYAKTPDGVHIAYQTVGEGPPDIVYANSFLGHIEVSWEYSRAVRFYERMAAFSRLVLFDRRGTGLSDPMVGAYMSEQRAEDIEAVMDTIGIERAVLLGSSEGAGSCAYFAAVHPERVAALVLFSVAGIVPPSEVDFPGVWNRHFVDQVLPSWETAGVSSASDVITAANPSLAGDGPAAAWYSRYFRLSASPALVRLLMRSNALTDIRDVLPSIQAPTLVIHRRDEQWVSVEYGRYAAEHIPSARLLELAGTDHFIWEENSEVVVDEIAEFVTGARRARDPVRGLKTLLFTDIVGSTEQARELGDEQWRALLGRHDAVIQRQVERFNGRVVKTTGDGVLATFDGPALGIQCAAAIREALRGLGLEIRAGVHTGRSSSLATTWVASACT